MKFLRGAFSTSTIMLMAAATVTFMGYEILKKTYVPSWSADQNYVLMLQGGETVFLKSFFTSMPTLRRVRMQKILKALNGEGIGPVTLKYDDRNLVMTHLDGRAMQLSDFREEGIMDALISSLQKVYRALATLEDLPQSEEGYILPGIYDFRALIRNNMNEQLAFLLNDLLDQWDDKFAGRIKAMGIKNIHGDLHTKNLLYDKKTGAVHILDFNDVRQGYILEDLSRLSMFGGFTAAEDERLVSALFPEEQRQEVLQLLDACKVWIRLMWACRDCVSLGVSPEMIAQAVFAETPAHISKVLPTMEKAFDELFKVSHETASQFLAAGMQEMQRVVRG